MTLGLLLELALALSIGAEPISVRRVWQDPGGLDGTILLQARLPRALLATEAGAALSLVGAALQALTRNELADPYVLGVSGGAALAAALAIALGLATSSRWGGGLLPLAAALGGLLATWLVVALRRRARAAASGMTLLLAGVMVNAMAGAWIAVLEALTSPRRSQELLLWLLGFLDVPSWSALGWLTAYFVLGSFWLLRQAGHLNVLALGARTARSLGVNDAAVELHVFLASSLLVGAIVSQSGLIGFVGLVVPHMVRRFTGADARWWLPGSAVAGAAVLLGCDTLSRWLFRVLGTELPVGAITASLGAPLFLLLLLRGAGRAVETT